jgi:type VI secretion system protein VasG
VDVRTVANVIADWTGVPLSSLMKDEQTELLTLENEIGKRVVGQDVALEAIAQRLRAAKTGLTSENGPQGVFLLVGPSGVGKPKPRLRWPMSCTAARSHSLRLTSLNTRSRTRFPS